jgi:hypothetical protein
MTPAVATAATTPSPEVPRVLLATARGPHPVYRVGETLMLQVQPTQDAYVYCYYQDATGTVARIFPNRFQPNAFINARHQIEIPPNGHAFDIRFDRAGGHETVACLAANRELGLKLPDSLKAQDLEPLPVRGLDDVAARFRDIGGTQVDDARLAVEVTQ